MNPHAHFENLSQYNQWANQQLYDAASRLTDEARRKAIGVYFQSLHGTLQHLLATDHAWTSLLCGQPMTPLDPADIVSFDTMRAARAAMDMRLDRLIKGMTTAQFDDIFSYMPPRGDFAGLTYREKRSDVLTHLFNHHAHHRGQAHTALSLLGATPPPLDLMAMQITR